MLYHIEFTANKRISQLSKAAICRAVEASGTAAMKALMPTTWKAQKAKMKKKSRQR